MAIESNAQDELKKMEKLREQRKPLFDRMDMTFSFFRGDKFQIPIAEGKWENVTSNRAQADGWKMINSLGAAARQISIEVKKEDSNDRNKISFNELLVHSMLFSAERQRDGLPETPLFQFEMAFYRVVRGWGSYRLLVMEDDDGKPYLDLAIWDPRNVNYISGRTGLVKAYNERTVHVDQVMDEYPSYNGGSDNDGLVKIVDVWDCSKRETEEAVIAGGEYLKKPTVVKVGGQSIDYLPIRIKAGGGVPYVNEGQTTNSTTSDGNKNIAKVGEDYLVNNRDLLEEESRAMSYKKTRAGLEAKMPTVIEWDSRVGDLPPEFEKDPYVKGGFIFLDVGKGQKITDSLTMTSGNLITQYHIDMDGKLNTGGLNPIAFGEGGSTETAFGVDIRNRNTREHMSPFKLGMEGDYVWIATEIVKQYKAGSFSDKQVFEGFDSKAQWFSEKIKSSSLEDGKVFRCRVIPEELRDRAAHTQMALDEASMLPLRERLDIHQLSDDPDASIEALWQQQADQMFNTPAVNGYLAMVKDYAKNPSADKKMKLNHAFQMLLLAQVQTAQALASATGGGQEQAPRKEGGANNPATTNRKVTTNTSGPKPQPRIAGGG